ncbi:Sodium/hydrogen exchanger family-domain-containing protein [Polychytrium aggregatum]|uniref:Sodium/hydrogen exchanger family-domain-containing protein n=1 Tax=Polychytrium aggregatum TaxID=110093 RepID=UPI0022FE3937|nr:Sodium/hydrogen exchanger family-domain-containing protein [Polychytrium aggregatum]KAI9203056.1 Sodium/hydrogen exchanger family-domain-containing protein [Polychytrium aggregatum]
MPAPTVSGFNATATGVFATGSPWTPEGLSLFFCQLVIILGVCRIIAVPFKYIQQPRVIAEVIGGIVLGPTLLGRWTWFQTTFFPPASMAFINLLANVGLLLFLMLMGLELDLSLIAKKWRTSLSISLTGMSMCFALSVGVSTFFYRNIDGLSGLDFTNFALFIGVAMSVTALPVLARILVDLKFLKTPLGTVVLSAASVDDAAGWTFLALVTALLNASSPIVALYIFLCALAFAIFQLTVTKWCLQKVYDWLTDHYHGNTNKGSHSISEPMVLISFLVCLASSFVTNAIGVHAIFGAFIAGLIQPRTNEYHVKLTERLEDTVTMLLLPLYFAYSGLKTNIGTMSDGLSWLSLLIVLSCVCFGKLGGCTAVARFALKFQWREALTIGALMNTKGLVEIIILNLGLDAGIINARVFSIMVLLAVCTTMMTTPLVRFFYPEKLWAERVEETEPTSPPVLDHKVLMVVPDIQFVPGLMTFMQFFKGSASPSSIPEDDAQKLVNVEMHAARLINLTGRMSAILIASESEEELVKRDSVINAFQAFAHLRRIRLNPHVVVAPENDQALQLSKVAQANSLNVLVVPWHPTDISFVTNKDETGLLSWFTSEMSSSAPSSAGPVITPSAAKSTDEFYNPPQDISIEQRKTSKNVGTMVYQLIKSCPLRIAVLVDRGFAIHVSSDPVISILVPYFGGPDDLEALSLALKLSEHHRSDIHVLHISLLDHSKAVEDIQPGLHSNQQPSSATLADPIPSLENMIGLDHPGRGDILASLKQIQSNDSSPIKIRYTSVEVEPVLFVNQVLNQIRSESYALVICGRTLNVPSKTTAAQGDGESKHKTQTEASSVHDTGADRASLASHQSLLIGGRVPMAEKILGPLGAAIVKSDVGNAGLIAVRKVKSV